MATPARTSRTPVAPRSTRESPEAEGAAIARSPLLIHSIDAFGELPLGALDIAAPRRIIEIGGEGGTFTRSLAAWAADHDAVVLCIDPSPSSALRSLAAETGLELVEAPSPQALDQIAPCDVYVIDGDHNWHTVHAELAAIAAKGGEPLVILHDVAWPCARRDQYYAPENLPAGAVHAHDFARGARPGEEELVAVGGFTGAGSFAYAEVSGGERNGVLTAVEDFIEAHDGWELARVPAIFGLGFVWPRSAPWADAMRAFIAPFHESALLANLEANRLALYLRVLDLQAEVETRMAQFARAAEGYEARIAELTGRMLAGETP